MHNNNYGQRIIIAIECLLSILFESKRFISSAVASEFDASSNDHVQGTHHYYNYTNNTNPNNVANDEATRSCMHAWL